eukprot:gene13310-19152_t
MKVVIFGTHPNQFNGYSKVVYEISKVWNAPDMELHIFGFQNMHNHPGHRKDVPANVIVFDALANKTPRAQGFGVNCARDYVTRIRPDVFIIFNDLIVLTTILREVCAAPNRSEFKVIAYIDQVYLSQRRDLLAYVNDNANAVLAFTLGWRDCIIGQGMRLPCFSLPHGFNPNTYFPVPNDLARRFFGLPGASFLILNLNRNQPRKRGANNASSDAVALSLHGVEDTDAKIPSSKKPSNALTCPSGEEDAFESAFVVADSVLEEVVFGYPMFDIERCIRFSMRHLVMNGFEVSRVNATKTMDISWLPHDKSKASFRHEIRPTTVNLPSSTTQKQFRDTSSRDVRPIPSVVHGDNDLILSIKRRPIESQQPFRCIDSFVPHNIFPSR